MRRTLALWLLVFGVYAATLGLDAFGESEYGGDEPHYLLAAESLVEDGNVDVGDVSKNQKGNVVVEADATKRGNDRSVDCVYDPDTENARIKR